jgi:hypothetical protein
MRNACKFLTVNLRRAHLEDLVIDERITLEWVLKNKVGVYGLGSSDSG